MPNRIIKESICESKKLSEVSFFAEDLYKRLITYADDYGRFNADYQVLRARLYPREIEIVTDEDIEDAMTELIGVGKIRFYTSIPRKEIYGCFPNWNEHQRVRDSKKKIPDPSDTTVNDWYLKRFVPLDLKIRIIERDKFKCRECGKFVCAGEVSAKRLVKMGSGLLHIDHIVPVNQGGRATEENLRLLCPRCNLKRKKSFTIEEIIALTDCGTLPTVAASCGELLPESNPIQSESNTNPNPKSNTNPGAHAREAGACGPATDPPQKAKRFTPPSLDEVKAYCQERGNRIDAQRFMDHYTSNGWLVGKNPMKDWRAAVRTWEKNSFESGGGKTPDYMTRKYSDKDFSSMEIDLDKI